MSDEPERGPAGSQHLTYLAGRMLPAVIGFVALISYSHIFDAGTYGEFAVLMGVSNIIIGSLFIWIRTTLTRFGATGDERSRRMIGVGLAVHAMFSAAVAMVLTIAALVLHDVSILLVGLLVVTIAFSDLNLDLLRAQHQVRRYGVQYFIRQVMTVLAVFLALLLHAPANPIVTGFVVGNLASSLTLIRQVWPRREYHFTRSDLRHFIGYGFPLSINYAISSLTYTVDRLIISLLLGKEAAGIYSLAADLVIQILGVIMDGITLAFLPHAARALDRSGRVAASAILIENLLVLLGVALPATFGLAVCGPYLASLALGAEFGAGAGLVVPLLAVAFLLRGVRVYFLDNVLQIHHRAGTAAMATAISATALALLCLVLVLPLGIVGGAIAAILSGGAAVTFGLVVARPLLAHDYPVRDLAKLIGAAAASAAGAYIVLTTWANPVGLCGAILTGVAVYLALVWTLDPGEIRRRAAAYVARS